MTPCLGSPTSTDASSSAVAAAIQSAVVRQLGDTSTWTKWPGGWPNQLSTALIDAVFSARARYTTKHGRGILPLVRDWQASTTAHDSITGLLSEIDDAGGPESWAAQRMNLQHAPGRKADAPHGATKAAAVREAAEQLKYCDIDNASDFLGRHQEAKKQLRKVPGIGDATTAYVGMLLGVPDVKPDRMVYRFVKDALSAAEVNAPLSNRLIRSALAEVANQMPAHVNETDLEHAIWASQRAVNNPDLSRPESGATLNRA